MFSNKEAVSPINDPFEFDKVIKEVDSVIAECMADITHTDREQSYFSVHGISNDIEETPDIVQKALVEMKSQIDKIRKKDALELAERMDTNYVNDPALHLKFLRGDNFNAASAAAKFVRHFEFKMELFGEAKLVKDIEQEDLDENDIKTLYSGYIQWLPLRDISGRTVAVFFPFSNGSTEISTLSKRKVLFYMRMIGMEDEAFQKKGIVTVISNGDSDSAGHMDMYSLKTHVHEFAQALGGVPGKQECVHFCFSNMFSISSFLLFSLVRFSLAAMDKLIAVRMRIHKGSSQQECMSKLQSFGIPVSVIPKSPSDNDYHVTIMKCRKRLELKRRQRKQHEQHANAGTDEKDRELLDDSESDDEFKVSLDPLDEECRWICTGPSPKDVILGRGRKANNHTGNIRLRTMVDELSSVYKGSSKTEKKEITQRIVLAIQSNGRFLKESEMYGWVEVPDEVARIKVSHAFRDTHKAKKNNTTDQTNSETLSGRKRGL